jgi:hypothetical protein
MTPITFLSLFISIIIEQNSNSTGSLQHEISDQTTDTFPSTLFNAANLAGGSTIALSGAVTLGPSGGGVSHTVNGNIILGSTGLLECNTASGIIRLNNTPASSTNLILHIRPNSGSKGYISFTENAVADRFAMGIDNGDSNFKFRLIGEVGTLAGQISSTGAWTLGPAAGASHIVNSGVGRSAFRVGEGNHNGSESTFRYTALSYWARQDNIPRTGTDPLASGVNPNGGATASIVFTDEPGNSGYPYVARSSSIEFWNATNYIAAYGQYPRMTGKISSTGAWTLGPASISNYNNVVHYINGNIAAGGTGTAVFDRGMAIGSNWNIAGTINPTRTTSLTGAAVYYAPRTSDNDQTIAFITNKLTTGTEVNAGGVTANGAWTLGPAAGADKHTINGGLVLSNNGTTGGIGTYSGSGSVQIAAGWYRRNDGAVISNVTGVGNTSIFCTRAMSTADAAAIRFFANYQDLQTAGSAVVDTNDKEIGFATASGAWTLGPSAGGVDHRINGSMTVKRNLTYGQIRVAPSTDNFETAIAFYKDVNGTTTGTSWVIGRNVGGSTNGDFAFYTEAGTGSATKGKIALNGAWFQGNNSASWSTTSDERLKRNIRNINGSLNKILGLNPVHFEYIHRPNVTKTGFIAQEFEKILPGHIVEQDCTEEIANIIPEMKNEKIKAIDMDLIPYLVKAIQELKAELDALKAQIHGA